MAARGDFEKFYTLLSDGEYDLLAWTMKDHSRCAVGARLGLGNLSHMAASRTIKEYDRELFGMVVDTYNAARTLRDNGKTWAPEAIERARAVLTDRLDRIAAHKIDRDRLDRIIQRHA